MRQEQFKTIKKKKRKENSQCELYHEHTICVRVSIQKGLMRVLRGGALLGGVIAMSR